MKDKIRYIKLAFYIILSMIGIVSAVVAFMSYFAKAKTVELIQERVDIGISNDQIFQQEQQVRQWENESKFQKRKKPPSDTEKKIIEEEEKRLKELEQAREEKIERYKKAK